MSISRVFGVGLFLISPFVFAELPSTNSNVERKIDAQQQKQQARCRYFSATNSISSCAFRG